MKAVLTRSVTTQEIQQLAADSAMLEELVNEDIPKENPRASKVISRAHGRSYDTLSGDAVGRIDTEDKFLYTILVDVSGHGPQTCSVAHDVVKQMKKSILFYHEQKRAKPVNVRERAVLIQAFIDANRFLGSSREESKLSKELERFLHANPPRYALTQKIQELNKELRREGQFASVIATSTYLPTLATCVVNASNTRPLIYNRTTGATQRINSTAPVVGPFKSANLRTYFKKKISAEQVVLQQGDVLFTYSDGFTEMPNQFGDRRGDDAFHVELFTAMDELRRGEPVKHIYDDIFRIPEGYRLQDDRTLVSLEVQ